MNNILSYNFYHVTNCNMCGAGPENFRIMGRRLNQSQGYSPRKKDGVLTTIKQCNTCKLVFSDPMPVPLRFEDHYGVPAEEYWKDQAPDWWQAPPMFVHNRIKALANLIELGPGSKMLDIGAGAGQVMLAFEKEGFDVYGIEPSKAFCDYIIQHRGVNAQRLQNVSVEDAEFPEGFFDFINFSVVLEHVVSPSDALAKSIKWLRPGGFMYMEVPSSNWLFGKLLNKYYRLIGTEMVTNLSPMHAPYHLYEFSVKSFELNGKMNGYEPKVVDFIEGSHPFPKSFTPLVDKIMNWTNTQMQVVVYLQRV